VTAYEYMVADADVDPNGAATSERKLDALGRDGWRLVSVVLISPPKDPDFLRHYMMREVAE